MRGKTKDFILFSAASRGGQLEAPTVSETWSFDCTIGMAAKLARLNIFQLKSYNLSYLEVESTSGLITDWLDWDVRRPLVTAYQHWPSVRTGPLVIHPLAITTVLYRIPRINPQARRVARLTRFEGKVTRFKPRLV